MRKSVAFTALMGLAGVATAAGLQVFTSQTAFIRELDKVETETFNSVRPGTVFANTVVDLGDLTFRYNGSPDGGRFDPFQGQPLFDVGNITPGNIDFVGEVNADGTPSGLHFFDFDNAINGFGGTFTGATSGARLTLSAAGSTVPLSSFLPDPGTGFFGVVSDTPFSRVTFGVEATTNPTINRSSEVFRLDNLRFGTIDPPVVQAPAVTPVPLPAGLLTLLSALGGFALLRWRRA